jgi:cytochrome b6-f complex iron-sulfur subunit
MSVAEILAAAKAKPGAAATKPAAAKVAPAAKPAAASAAKAAAPKPAAAKADGGTATAPKDTASILAAARKGAKPGPMTKAEAAAKAAPAAPTAKKKIEVPPMPAKPDYARPPTPVPGEVTARRGFFAAAAGVLFGSSLAIGFTSLAVTHLMWLLGFARFMFPNILIEPPTRFKVGFPDGLSPGQVETKFIPQFGVWVVRYEYDGQPMIFAIKSVCTHLGCTPNWLEAEQKFKCPCHGSGFYKDGINFEGPAPRPLERYAISLAEDGQLLVDKSRQFQQELGQWKDTASYVPV